MEQRRKLYRSEKNRLIAGVCGGLADYFNTDPILVRLIFVLSAFVSGLGIIAYIVLWIMAPRDSSQEVLPKETVKENINEIPYVIRKYTASTWQRQNLYISQFSAHVRCTIYTRNIDE